MRRLWRVEEVSAAGRPVKAPRVCVVVSHSLTDAIQRAARTYGYAIELAEPLPGGAVRFPGRHWRGKADPPAAFVAMPQPSRREREALAATVAD